ncbi:MAG: spondin domain-containing protein [Bacteroidetes bacterium]|nr:spondin domain-containing protein [Bacteroidota bacterium]MCY4232469.1 spondin domain-containing protein [Bacteroidota bacterium]
MDEHKQLGTILDAVCMNLNSHNYPLMKILHFPLLCSYIFCSFFVTQMVSAQSTAEYELTFNATWSAQTHPDRFPSGSNPHFTSLIGGTHNSSVTFWEVGSTATSGIESMAETGSTGGVRREVEAAIASNTAKSVLSGPSVTPSPNSVTMTFDIDSRWSLVTITSMLAPSPDWFIGVSGLDLMGENGEWMQTREVELFAYDAGSEDGTEYSLSNPDTQPKENIRRIQEAPFLVNGTVKSVGTFVFELQNTKSIEVSRSTVTVTEGESETFDVTLSSAPSGTVNVRLSSSSDQLTVAPTELTFTSTTYSDNMTVTITAPLDDDSDDLTGTSITLTASGGGYDNLTNKITVNVDDITLTNPTIEIDPNMVSIPEGESTTLSVNLSERPISDVTITLSEFDNSNFSRSPSSLIFNRSNFDQAQSVEITLSEDDDSDDESSTLTLTATGGGYDGQSMDVSVSGDDDDLADAMILVNPSTLTVAPDGFKLFLVTLSIEPSADVTVMLSKLTTAGLTSSVESLDFTTSNFGNPKSVMISASGDAAESDPETLTLTADGGGYDNASATVSVSIKNAPPIPKLSLTVDPNPVNEGGVATIKLTLSEGLSSNAIVPLIIEAVTAEEDDYVVSVTELLIYAITQTEATEILEIKEDDDLDDETLTVSLGDLPEELSGAEKPNPVLVTIKDNDADAPMAVFINNAEGDSIDVYLNDKILIDGFSFQESRIENLQSGEITLDLVKADAANNDAPLNSYRFFPQPGIKHHLIIQKSSEDVLSIIDLDSGEFGDSDNKVRLRAIHGASDLGTVNLLIHDAENSTPVDTLKDLRFGAYSQYVSLDRKLLTIAIILSSTGQEIGVYKLDLSENPEEIFGLFLLSGKGMNSAEGFSPFGVWSSGKKFMPLVVTNVDDHPLLDVEEISVGHYPNPFMNNANLWFDLPETSEIEIQVVDLLGRTAFSTLISNRSGAHQNHQIDTSGWPAGVYLYRLVITSETGQTISTGKMTKVQ